jgi:hypothetical protein
MVSMLAIGPEVLGFKPSRGDVFLTAINICNMPSFGGEVKLKAPCCKILWHVKYHLESMNKNTSQGQIRHFLRMFLLLATRSTVLVFSLLNIIPS